MGGRDGDAPGEASFLTSAAAGAGRLARSATTRWVHGLDGSISMSWSESLVTSAVRPASAATPARW